jgi:hypothetical protein
MLTPQTCTLDCRHTVAELFGLYASRACALWLLWFLLALSGNTQVLNYFQLYSCSQVLIASSSPLRSNHVTNSSLWSFDLT